MSREISPSRSRRLLLAVCGCVLWAACAPEGCPGSQDGGAVTCRLDRDCPTNATCVDGACIERQVCAGDSECDLEKRCDRLTGLCIFRDGFCDQCGPNNENAGCAVGQFCALGCCRDTTTAIQCTRRYQCPVGWVCDRQAFYCIQEQSCGLAELEENAYPELACDPGETCNVESGFCGTNAPPECTPGAAETGCAADELCNGAGRCVQCITNSQCGPGLRCNSRAGLCEGENTCRSDAECRAPLVCDRTTAVCAVPLPPCQSDFDCQLGQFCDRTVGTCQPREGKCIDDRFEDADTPPAARLFELAEGEDTIVDLQLCANDADVFAVPLAAGDQLTAEILGARAQARAEISAIAADGLTTLRFAEAPPRGNGQVSFVADIEGRYFIRLMSIASQSAYSLHLVRTFAGVCSADVYEPASNSPFSAPDIQAGAHGNLSLCFGDEDWYRVATGLDGSSVQAGQSVTVELQGPLEEDFDLVLTDAFGETVLARSEGPGAHEYLRFRFDELSDVRVGVVPYGSAAGSYVLTLTVQDSFVCVADELDLPATGTGSGHDDGGLSNGGDDAGLFVDAGGEDAASLVDAGTPADAGTTIDAGASTDAGATATDAGAASDAATVDSGVPVDAGADGGVAVGNNTRASATPVGLEGIAKDLSICTGDEDWFVVEARAHQRVLVTASWPAGESGVRVDAFDAANMLIATGSGTTVAALSVPGNDQARVYIRIHSPSASSPYHLDIDVERRLDCLPDNAEPNNTPSYATPAPDEGLFTICGTDVDLFRLAVTAGKRVKVDVDFSTADGDVDVAILLPDGVSILDVSDGVTGHESLDTLIPADPPDGGLGAYFIEVFSGRSDTKARYHIATEVLSQ